MPGFGCLRAEGENRPSRPSHAVVFAQNQRDEVRDLNDKAGALASQPGAKQQTYVAYGVDCRNGALNEDAAPTMQAKANGGQSLNCMPPVLYCNSSRDDVAATLDASYYKGTGARNGKEREVVAMSVVAPTRRYIVRRLTPTECARLQGFPDWWTDGVEGSDSAKYKMWGNGMALPCVLAVLNGIGELERLTRRTCPTCAHHLGGGQCRLNAEAECCEGGGFELWEAKDA